MESRWRDEDREVEIYIQLVGRQGSSTIFRLPRDPRRPEETQCSLHLSSSGPFTLSLNQTRGGGVVRFPGFGKNSWDISLIFYIQHYPCWAICPWFRVNPLLWFNTSGQPFLIRIMQFRSKSCQCCKSHRCTTAVLSGWPSRQIPQTGWPTLMAGVLTWKLSLSRLNSAEVQTLSAMMRAMAYKDM